MDRVRANPQTRNWLFADTVKGAKTSAALYSIVSTARANGLEPYAYLRRLFAELPKAKTIEDFEVLLPFNPLAILSKGGISQALTYW